MKNNSKIKILDKVVLRNVDAAGTVSGGTFGAWSGGAMGAATFCGI
ncbi:Uncharacterised protein [Staphylococcus piscifermentans]|uniref:Uncharacterized protein n=1 Tax=Staphylococcus piscifermentans TaxID=70258 RepID=A0A239TR31_9STAP|nr:hypothetical protein [Staphylococcus piscifermentans]GEP84618.1 hypothetical protein SPI02_12030 [Staphylococcus piscifermentans]SNV00421.1 Uncharacterised protein [Staphylococcus piscifermentans]